VSAGPLSRGQARRGRKLDGKKGVQMEAFIEKKGDFREGRSFSAATEYENHRKKA